MVPVPESTLTIAGDGNGRSKLTALVERLGLAARVRFVGQVSPEQTVSIYDQARVVVVPSRWPEPFGMVGIEAMRRGRLVVAAQHGGIPEWMAPGMSDQGFLPGNVADLTRALRRALSRSDGEQVAEEARRWVHATFAFDAMVAEVEGMLRG